MPHGQRKRCRHRLIPRKAEAGTMKRRQKGNKTDTVTNEKGRQKETEGRQGGLQRGATCQHVVEEAVVQDTATQSLLWGKEMLHGQRTWQTKAMKSPGRQMNRIVAWPAEKGGHQQQHKGWTHLKKELRTPKRQQCSRHRTSNRNAAWPAEKGERQQCRHRTWKTRGKKSHGRQMNRNTAWPAEKGHQQCRHRT